MQIWHCNSFETKPSYMHVRTTKPDMLHSKSLCFRCNLASVSKHWHSCILLFAREPRQTQQITGRVFKFPFILIGKLTMAFWTGKSWWVLKFRNTGGAQNEGFDSVSEKDVTRVCGTGSTVDSPGILLRKVGQPATNCKRRFFNGFWSRNMSSVTYQKSPKIPSRGSWRKTSFLRALYISY